MRITESLLVRNGVNPECSGMVKFCQIWPRGVDLTIGVMLTAEAEDIDPICLANLLPKEGTSSRRSFALWCVERVMYLVTDLLAGMEKIRQCIRGGLDVDDLDNALTWAVRASGTIAIATAVSAVAEADAREAASAAAGAVSVAAWSTSVLESTRRGMGHCEAEDEAQGPAQAAWDVERRAQFERLADMLCNQDHAGRLR